MCVCCFSIYSGRQVCGRTSRGHTGRSDTISYPPSFCGACLNFSREKDSAVPFPRRPWSRILCTNKLVVLHLLGIFIFIFIILTKLRVTSQLVIQQSYRTRNSNHSHTLLLALALALKIATLLYGFIALLYCCRCVKVFCERSANRQSAQERLQVINCYNSTRKSIRACVQEVRTTVLNNI